MIGVLLIIFSLWLTLAHSYNLLPRTKRPILTRSPVLPEAVVAQGHKALPELQIPNKKFCRDVQLKPYRHYLILPWWYVHCENILEKDERLIREKKKLLPIYGMVLVLVKQYKKKQALVEPFEEKF